MRDLKGQRIALNGYIGKFHSISALFIHSEIFDIRIDKGINEKSPDQGL
jgi:hypothetical protein